jgi:ABC-type branched-subunit amino acid transport system substrate-binding protein
MYSTCVCNRAEPTVSGWLPQDFLDAYRNFVLNKTLFGDQMTSQGYDAVWALALALEDTRQDLIHMGKTQSPE